MPTIKAVVYIPTGEFRNKQSLFECGYFDPIHPELFPNLEGIALQDPDYDVVIVPRIPDPRTEKWADSVLTPKTDQEIAIYDSNIQEEKATKINSDLQIQAVAQLDYEERQKLQIKVGQKLLNPKECKDRVLAIYRSMLKDQI